MNSFKKWHGKKIEDWGSVMSDDAKSFYRAFKNYLKREFPDCEIIGFKPNHYDFSGFINKDGKYIYISHSIDRSKERVDFNDSSVFNGVLYRTAAGPRDFRGGQNNFCSINKLGDCVRALFDRMQEPIKESKQLNEKLYSVDEIQDMIIKCKQDKDFAKKVIDKIHSAADKRAVQDVIADGWYERFDRYDSAVCDDFISAYEVVSQGKMESTVTEGVEDMSFQVYKGYDISYNFYGKGEYTVQFEGDDVVFDSVDAAKAFIDQQVDGEEPVEEANGFKTYELELDFEVDIEKPISDRDFELITEHLTGLKDATIEVYDVDRKDQEFKLNVVYEFEGKIDWDVNGIGQSFYDFEGAPDNSVESELIDQLKTLLAGQSIHLDTQLSKDDFDVELIGKSIDVRVEEIVKDAAYYTESGSMSMAVDQILEGKNIYSVLSRIKKS